MKECIICFYSIYSITKGCLVIADNLFFDVIAGISLYENLFTDSRYDITSVNFNSENVHEDDIFVQQDILQFF